MCEYYDLSDFISKILHINWSILYHWSQGYRTAKSIHFHLVSWKYNFSWKNSLFSHGIWLLYVTWCDVNVEDNSELQIPSHLVIIKPQECKYRVTDLNLISSSPLDLVKGISTQLYRIYTVISIWRSAITSVDLQRDIKVVNRWIYQNNWQSQNNTKKIWFIFNQSEDKRNLIF